MTALRPSTQLHPDGLADGNVLGLVGTAYGPAQAIKPVGLTGATNATRYVGGTTTGHPTSGTFIAGDYVVTADGHVWVCSTGGSPGTWVDIAGSGGGMTDPTTTKGDLIVHGTSTTRLGVGTDGQVLTADSTQTLGVKWGAAGGASPGQVLAYVSYNPGTETTTTTTSTTAVAIDTTNLIITFTAPASGNVEIMLESAVYNGGSNGFAGTWGLLNAANTEVTYAQATALGGIISRPTLHLRLTGLTSGTSYTYKWSQRISNGTSSSINTRYGGTIVGPAVMKATYLP